MDELFGGVILEFIGAAVKWLFTRRIHIRTRKRNISFGEILDENKRKGAKGFDAIILGWSNVWVGLLVLVIFILMALER
jgi:hypothetical protein